MKLALSKVHVDPTILLRGADMDRVIAMDEFVAQGGTLPPIVVVGDDNLLADGTHRYNRALRAGDSDIEVDHREGDRAEAIAIAMVENAPSKGMPLTRTERNKGVKLLLEAGWTLDRIAKGTGVHKTTVLDIQHAMVMRGQVTKPATNSQGRSNKQVAVLPATVHEKLSDTTLTRIADVSGVDKQRELAEAVAKTGLSEPRVREAVKAVNKGTSPADAVAGVAPAGMPIPVTAADVAKQVRRRLERFLAEPMTVQGKDRDFWQVLDVLVAATQTGNIQLESQSLARLLSEVAINAEAYATRLRSAKVPAPKRVSA